VTPLAAEMAVPRFLGEGRIDWVDKPVPEPMAGELLVAVAANAVCGTDRLQLRFGSAVTPGHEAAGTVAAAGAGTSVPVGTRGVVYLMGYCGSCRSCRLGHTNQCLDKRPDLGFEADGGYCPYEIVDERNFFPVDANTDLAEATLLLDVMGTSGHAIERARRVRADIESVVIAGAGPIGLGLVVMAKVALGEEVPVFITDTAPYRLRLAADLGAVAVDLGERSLSDALNHRGLVGVDVGFDAAGKEDARRSVLAALNKRGVLVCVGHGQGLTLKVSPDLIATERAVLGSEYFRYDELPANADLLRAHRDYVGRILTHRFPTTAIEEAFELFNAGETGKVVLQP
jgi:threonine 3-dehydrogenase